MKPSAVPPALHHTGAGCPAAPRAALPRGRLHAAARTRPHTPLSRRQRSSWGGRQAQPIRSCESRVPANGEGERHGQVSALLRVAAILAALAVILGTCSRACAVLRLWPAWVLFAQVSWTRSMRWYVPEMWRGTSYLAPWWVLALGFGAKSIPRKKRSGCSYSSKEWPGHNPARRQACTPALRKLPRLTVEKTKSPEKAR